MSDSLRMHDDECDRILTLVRSACSAYGFKLDTLSKLKNSKSVDGSGNLLHFVVQNLKTNNPSTHEGLKIDLSPLHAAARIELTALQTDINKMVNLSKKLRKSLDSTPEKDKASSTDRFYKFFSEFYERSAIGVDSVGERLKKLESNVTLLVLFFAEEPSKLGMDALFQLFDAFQLDYKQAEQDILKKAEILEKQKKTDAEKAKREQEKVRERNNCGMHSFDSIDPDALLSSCVVRVCRKRSVFVPPAICSRVVV